MIQFSESLLIDREVIEFLTKVEVSRTKMKATVRPAARHTTCACGTKFSLVHPKLGYICNECRNSRPNKFVVDLFWQGKRRQIYSDKNGLALDTYDRAYNIAAQIQSELDQKTFDPTRYVKAELTQFSVAGLIEKYIEDRETQIAPSYLKHWKRNLRLAKDKFAAGDIREIRKVDLNGYISQLRKLFPKHTDKTIKNIFDDFKAFMNYCRTEYNVLESVPPFPVIDFEEADWRWLDQNAQMKAFNLIAELYPQDTPIFALLFLQGLRPGEARALRCKDADIRLMKFNVTSTFSGEVFRRRRKGKKSKPSQVPIHPELQVYIEERVKNNMPDAFIFINPRTGLPYKARSLDRIWSITRKKLGLDKEVRLYDASRHSVATLLTSSGTTLFTASKILGHSSTKTTERYAHEHIEAMRSDLKKLSLLEKGKLVPIRKSS